MNNDAAILVEGVSKRFRIGTAAPYARFSEMLVNLPAAALRLLRRPAASGGLAGTRAAGPTDFWALRDVSFEVRRGEILGIIGRNGAGKSTLLKVLSRIIEPTTGRIRLRGRIASLLEVGTGFHPELTGRENIYLNGAIMGMTRREIAAKFGQIVAFSEIEKFLDTPVKHYSSGMYVRLGFAVAAHLEPEILVVDEVLAVGDAAFQKKCLGKMSDVARGGRTVLVVSHNMATITQLCERALLLDQGHIVEQGNPHVVVERYLRSVAATTGEVSWPDPAQAPGTDVARLRSVRILQDGVESPTRDIDISREIAIEITYQCLRPRTPLHTAIWLKHSHGAFVLSSASYASMSLTQDQWTGRPFPAGVFCSVCRIPANFLNNEGDYLVSAFVGRDIYTTEARAEDVLSFTVHDTGAMRAEYKSGPWHGVVRPRLAWNTQMLTDDDPRSPGQPSARTSNPSRAE